MWDSIPGQARQAAQLGARFVLVGPFPGAERVPVCYAYV